MDLPVGAYFHPPDNPDDYHVAGFDVGIAKLTERQVSRLIFQISRRQFAEAEPTYPKGLPPCETTGSSPVVTATIPGRKTWDAFQFRCFVFDFKYGFTRELNSFPDLLNADSSMI